MEQTKQLLVSANGIKWGNSPNYSVVVRLPDSLRGSSKIHCKPIRIDCDTSKWVLYKIINIDNRLLYKYIQVITYGVENEYGWSDGIGHIETRCIEDNKLYGWCSIKDTTNVNPLFKMVTNNCNP